MTWSLNSEFEVSEGEPKNDLRLAQRYLLPYIAAKDESNPAVILSI